MALNHDRFIKIAAKWQHLPIYFDHFFLKIGAQNFRSGQGMHHGKGLVAQQIDMGMVIGKPFGGVGQFPVFIKRPKSILKGFFAQDLFEFFPIVIKGLPDAFQGLGIGPPAASGQHRFV